MHQKEKLLKANPMDKELFYEAQIFRQKILWVFLSIVCGGSIVLFSIAFVKQTILGEQFGDEPSGDYSILFGLLLVICFTIFLFWFFLKIKLETMITENVVKYRFWPFIRTYKVIPFDVIESINVEKYRPIREYGGWGYRVSLKGRGLCLNVSKNMGLRIITKDGFELLIGTQREDDLRATLNQLKK